jgi:uncharacterized protein (DUF4415 family)
VGSPASSAPARRTRPNAKHSGGISNERAREIANIPDARIDTSDIPELDEAFFRTARLVTPADRRKLAVSLRVDAEVLEWFRAGGKGYQGRMNAVLRAWMLRNRDDG